MSSEGFRGIPGVPEGWELVGFRRLITGDWYINNKGNPEQWNQKFGSVIIYPIIRKIETPKKYRPFRGGAEYMASGQQGVAVDWNDPNTPYGFYAVVSANGRFLWVALGDVIERYDWEQAFEKLKFRHADGSTSPFGVEVTE